MQISNLEIYDLENSIKASGLPMRTEADTTDVTEKDIDRCISLVNASNGNGAHGQWLTGVRVAMDLRVTNKMWVELERYRFVDFVSSQSTMHRITKFDPKDQVNKYVDSRVVAILEEKIEKYNAVDVKNVEEKKEAYLKVLYNVPSGFELTARITTNYRSLLNIYVQRHDHRLPEWREFCKELLKLPMFSDIVGAYYGEYNLTDLTKEKKPEPKPKKTKAIDNLDKVIMKDYD